jgi:hypothetical protein
MPVLLHKIFQLGSLKPKDKAKFQFTELFRQTEVKFIVKVGFVHYIKIKEQL